MVQWWNNLSLLQQIFYYCAIPSTLILIIQTILTLVGLGNDGGDIDTDVDVDVDTAGVDLDSDGTPDTDVTVDVDVDTSDVQVEGVSGLRFFSIRGMVAFFVLFGWVGVALAAQGVNTVIIFIIAFISGIIGMFIVALLFYAVSKLQYNGNKSLKNAIGQIGQVYIPIPANMNGKGKIQVMLQENLTEVNAMTEEGERLTTGCVVMVVDVLDSETVIVEKQNK